MTRLRLNRGRPGPRRRGWPGHARPDCRCCQVVVVTSEHSEPFLQDGAASCAVTARGEHGWPSLSRLPEDSLAELSGGAAGFAAPLVVRSSSALEGSGVWSGAFTSYLDIPTARLPKAVVGCYASAFSQSTVERFGAAGSSPAQAAMAVLIQPALSPDFGGTARIQGDDVVVIGVKGSPVPLVQGWDPGEQAIVNGAGVVRGAAAVATLGEEVIRSVAAIMRRAQQLVGANTCEWAVQGERPVVAPGAAVRSTGRWRRHRSGRFLAHERGRGPWPADPPIPGCPRGEPRAPMGGCRSRHRRCRSKGDRH